MISKIFKTKLWRPVITRSMPKQNLQQQPPPPSCKDCKWSVDDGKLCLLFKLASNNEIFSTESLRKNINLCGPEGVYFREIKKEIK